MRRLVTVLGFMVGVGAVAWFFTRKRPEDDFAGDCPDLVEFD